MILILDENKNNGHTVKLIINNAQNKKLEKEKIERRSVE